MDRIGSRWMRERLWHAVGRDGHTEASADESRQLELCRYMWWVRHATLGTALAIGLRTGLADRAERLAAILFLLQVVGHAWSRAVPARAGLVAVFDALGFVILAALGLAPALVLFVAIAILGWAATFRPVPAATAYLAVLVAVGLMMRRTGGPDPGIGVLAFCLLGGIFMMRTIRLNIGARQAAERDRLVSERVDAILWEEVPGTDTITMSPAAERILGYPSSAWSTPGFWRTVAHPDDLPQWMSAGADRADTPGHPLRLRHADGSWRGLESRTSTVTDRHGQPAFAVGVLLDRTEQLEAEREALAFGHLVALSPIGQILLACGDDGTIVVEAVNPACRRALGLPDSAVGSPWSERGEGGAVVGRLLAAVRAEGASSVEFTGADGRTYQAEGTRVERNLCKIDLIDVTERVETGRRLHRQARQDELTGMPNRRGLLESLDARLGAAAGERTALLVLDLDGFKEINDSLGHLTGDELLRRIGQRIVAALRPGETAARLGGDEFAVLAPGLDAAAAAVRARTLAEALQVPVEVDDLRLRVRVSVGFAVHPTDAADAAELIRHADVAMYQAKRLGADEQHYDAASDGFSSERVTLTADLYTGIADDQLRLHYQPLFAVATGEIVGTEALVRWQHPTLGLIPPGRFTELAEASGQMKPLTRWVVRRALEDLRDLGPAGGALEVSVNLSVRNLYEADFLAWLSDTLADVGVPARRLIIELTESTAMVDHAAAIRMVEGMRELGVRTWIDDFGTGHSSLARLRTLPVDGVKIDRAFVTGSPASAKDRGVLRSLIDLVGSLGLATIAEGVEQAECLEVLRDLGCDLAQGFHLALPMPADGLAEFLGITRPAGALPLLPRPAGPPHQEVGGPAGEGVIATSRTRR
jgi:diguanylate cyclase (GGDEF)-like protein